MDADETVIIAALAAATGITYINQVATKQELTFKPVISLFVAGSFLLLVSMWNTSVAAMFAVLILVTSVVLNGNELFKTLSKVAA